jgi:hypothetical protein
MRPAGEGLIGPREIGVFPALLTKTRVAPVTMAARVKA